MATSFSVYGLYEPLGELRYVGLTTRKLRCRMAEHLRPSELAQDTHKNRWIKTILAKGQRPYISIIQELPNKLEMGLSEIYWIKYFKDNGARLTNNTKGGDGVLQLTTAMKKFWFGTINIVTILTEIFGL